MISAQFLLTAFAVVLAPGTGVIYTLALGLGQGRKAAIWAALGGTIGIVPHLAAATLGLAAVLHSSALLFQIVKAAGVAYLLYLAWKIGNSSPVADQATTGTPMTFLQAAAFQWVNPKAWTMALTAISVYAPDRTGWTIVLVAATFGAVNLPCVSSWTVIGQQMAKLLKSPRRLIAFNWTMAALLVLSIIPTL
jgi:threonine/homoserine/homoserine lactone efflux protein